MTKPKYRKLEQEEINNLLGNIESEVQNLSVHLEMFDHTKKGDYIIRARETLEDIKTILHSIHY